jgi:hypothetical protein
MFYLEYEGSASSNHIPIVTTNVEEKYKTRFQEAILMKITTDEEREATVGQPTYGNN